MILDERGFSGFEEWADRISLVLDRYGDVPTIISAKEWPRWAAAVCQLSSVAGQNPPAPQYFKDWRS